LTKCLKQEFERLRGLKRVERIFPGDDIMANKGALPTLECIVTLE
jgi:hypothetical protein